jgi:hypothetical protein
MILIGPQSDTEEGENKYIDSKLLCILCDLCGSA